MPQKANFSTTAAYAYVLCGWHTRSEIPLTSVPTSVRGGERVDIVIRIAHEHSRISRNAGPVVLKHSAERSLISIRDVADFEVVEGREIRIWPAVGVAQKDIEIFLFGPAWASLCHQRGLLPLHASAVAAGRGIAAFAGHSGAGKSTTAALLSSLDYELVADDVLPISFNHHSVPGAWPYLRRLKLRSDLIDQLALTPTGLVSETLDKEKYFVCPKQIADDRWSRLDRLYLLEIDPSVSGILISRITGADAVRALIDQTYHFQFIIGSGQFREHLAFCTLLASKIAVYRLRRPPYFDAGNELGSLICAHLEDGLT